MSLPQSLAGKVRDQIVARFELKEVTGPEGGPLMTLRAPEGSPMGPAPVGWVRVFNGGPLQKLVNVGLVVPPIGLDSHMVFAFTRADSAIPHFTVDAVKTAETFAFHLDLIPRADLGAHLAYMNAAFEPLTETFLAASRGEGLTAARLSPRQLALMSPWMLAFRATEDAFRAVDGAVSRYLEHWTGLVTGGLPAEATATLDAATLARRDRDNRAALFDPDVDPVWRQVDRLLGAAESARVRELLKNTAA